MLIISSKIALLKESAAGRRQETAEGSPVSQPDEACATPSLRVHVSKWHAVDPKYAYKHKHKCMYTFMYACMYTYINM